MAFGLPWGRRAVREEEVAEWAAALTDVHAHVLPGVDDGPATWDEALALCRDAAARGTRTLVATPHYIPGGPWAVPWPRVRERAEELQRRLDAAGIPLRVRPGQELMLDPLLPDHLRDGNAGSLSGGEAARPGDTVLVELPLTGRPLFLFDVLHELSIMGLKVLLAHTERYEYLRAEDLEELARMGVRFQVNAGSFLPGASAERRTRAWQLLRAGHVAALGSDTHGAHRPPGLDAALRAILTERQGKAWLEAMRSALPMPPVSPA